MISPRGARILIADDEPAIRRTLAEILRRDGYRVSVAASGQAALDVLRREPVKLVIADLSMPGMDGLELTRNIVADWPTVPVMILTGHGSIEAAVQAMRVGASDFLLKPLDPGELLVRISRSLDMSNLRSQHSRLVREAKRVGHYGDMIGTNREMKKIFKIIERVAEMPSQVLIEGEPGTGKELIARAIHDRSLELRTGGKSSADFPYIAVNCGAFSRTLLESQLFGHKKGAFTGAVADQEGVFVAAGYGTLFLDEITELHIDLQVKLLRAIQEREVTPLGSTQAVPIHARILTATNRAIHDLARQGEFRPDLFYRINVVNIKVPPLRERVDDVPILVRYFLRSTAEKYGMEPREPSDDVMEAFMSYSWPGNVRELQNVIERSFALGRYDGRLSIEDLPQDLLAKVRRAAGDPEAGEPLFPSYDQVVRNHVVSALQASRGVKSRAAELLRIDRNRLYRLMRKYEISEL